MVATCLQMEQLQTIQLGKRRILQLEIDRCQHEYIRTHTHTHTHIHIRIYARPTMSRIDTDIH